MGLNGNKLAVNIRSYFLIITIALLILMAMNSAKHDREKLTTGIIEWDVNEIVKVGSNLNHNQYFQKTLQSILQSIYSDPECIAIIYLSDICSSCASGGVIARLNEIQINLKQVCAIYIMLNSDLYSEDDLEIIKQNEGFDLNFSIEDERLKEYEYNSFVQKAISTVQGLALIVDRNGEVLFATDLLDVNKRLNAAEYTSFIKQIVSISQHGGET